MSRVSTEINFVGISIGIPIEINFVFRRNYWSKLSKLIGISVSTIKIEIPISNQNRHFVLFQWKMLWNFDIGIEIWYPNWNSDVEIEYEIKIRIGIPTSKSKPKFRHRNRNFDDVPIYCKFGATFLTSLLTASMVQDWNEKFFGVGCMMCWLSMELHVS
jgi:hypothetical protein